MHKVTIYPLGNADSIAIEIDDHTDTGRLVLFDYGNEGSGATDDKRIDLEKALRSKLEDRSFFGFDVVAVSHLDRDHICGMSNFFYFDHAAKYQGEGRAKINELWVPAAVLIEEACEDEARIVQAEARHRFTEKSGIRVISGPSRLDDWMKRNKLTWEGREHLVVNAGQMMPDYDDKVQHGVEFFVHSPFAHVQNQCAAVVRNDDCLVMQATFHTSGHYGGRDTCLILSADAKCEVLAEIVNMTKHYKNEDRLKWDLFKLPHHCSYRSLSTEKGTTKTEPIAEVAWLFEQGQRGGRIISTSDPILSTDTKLPPHFQAANTHKDRARSIAGEFLVTMEYPSKDKPEPMVFKIDNLGVTPEKASMSGATAITSSQAPRAGEQ